MQFQWLVDGQLVSTTSTLTHEFDTIVGPKWATQNLIVDGDSIYVAINNAYEWGNYKGLIGIVDMNSMSYVDEIDLGLDGGLTEVTGGGAEIFADVPPVRGVDLD